MAICCFLCRLWYQGNYDKSMVLNSRTFWCIYPLTWASLALLWIKPFHFSSAIFVYSTAFKVWQSLNTIALTFQLFQSLGDLCVCFGFIFPFSSLSLFAAGHPTIRRNLCLGKNGQNIWNKEAKMQAKPILKYFFEVHKLAQSRVSPPPLSHSKPQDLKCQLGEGGLNAIFHHGFSVLEILQKNLIRPTFRQNSAQKSILYFIWWLILCNQFQQHCGVHVYVQLVNTTFILQPKIR